MKLKASKIMKFIWTNKGKILVRETETTKIIHIKSKDDVDKLTKQHGKQ